MLHVHGFLSGLSISSVGPCQAGRKGNVKAGSSDAGERGLPHPPLYYKQTETLLLSPALILIDLFKAFSRTVRFCLLRFSSRSFRSGRKQKRTARGMNP